MERHNRLPPFNGENFSSRAASPLRFVQKIIGLAAEDRPNVGPRAPMPAKIDKPDFLRAQHFF
ncbi:MULTISPECIES: hypothetical protein [unclassified Sphingomonas]|jgi:hypothetical protein|uniref:hypothetical protein n=1 Tax=unclassified Sphingomonas TaxID=196159 RepID=UPI00053E13E9|nr:MULTISPECIES: hypothetical protein [unclassified Sphingomonas]